MCTGDSGGRDWFYACSWPKKAALMDALDFILELEQELSCWDQFL